MLKAMTRLARPRGTRKVPQARAAHVFRCVRSLVWMFGDEVEASPWMRNSHCDEFSAEARICRTFCDDDSCAAAIGRSEKIVADGRCERPFIVAALAQPAGPAQAAAWRSLSAF